jgi:hypothetical protein
MGAAPAHGPLAAPGDERPSASSVPGVAVQRECAQCEEEAKEETMVRRQAATRSPDATAAPSVVEEALRSPGQPLDRAVRAFMEPRFGMDFRHVRVHIGPSADASARAARATAYTVGQDMVFREGAYAPGTAAGRRLIAHELTHVVQQASIPTPPRASRQPLTEDVSGVPYAAGVELRSGVASSVIQRWPGDGMVPPGDCSWATYLGLRGSVETAKAVVSMVGACSAGDNCNTLALKIAAITAEIAARVALDTTCFKGGDTGHRQQLQDKINMLNRCYRFFADSNCPPELVAAMAVVVDRAREVIAGAAVVVAIALVVALVAAIIALVDVIAALLAAGCRIRHSRRGGSRPARPAPPPPRGAPVIKCRARGSSGVVVT